jgi:hypothetical protein
VAIRFALAALLALALAAPAEAALQQKAPRIEGPRVLPAAGGTLTVVDVARNAGRRRTRATRTRFLLSRDAFASADDVVLGRRKVPRLRHGRASRRTLVLAVPPLTAGTWRLIACSRRCRAAVLRLVVLAPPAPPPPPPPPPPDTPPSQEPRADQTVVLPTLDLGPGPPPPGPRDPASVRDCDPVTPEDGEPAAAFTEMFAAARLGWTGGDGTFSLRLPSGETAWLFGDTFLGGLTTIGGRDQPYPDVRNTLVVQDASCLTTHFRGTLEAPSGFALTADSTWLWPNQPVVHGDTIRVFWTRMKPEPAPFAVDGVTLVTYDEHFAPQSTAEVPALPGQWWGAAFADAGAYTYVFGIRDSPRAVFLARTPLHDLDGTWEYRTASGWSAAIGDAAPVLEGALLSTQISVIPDGGGWALVSQEPLGSQVDVWRSADLVAWGAPEPLTTIDPVVGGQTYNALVHPAMTAGDELLLSYNVNAESTLVMAQADLYRPRFVRAALP